MRSQTPRLLHRLALAALCAFPLLQAGTAGIALVIIGAMVPSLPVLLLGSLSIGFAGQSAIGVRPE